MNLLLPSTKHDLKAHIGFQKYIESKNDNVQFIIFIYILLMHTRNLDIEDCEYSIFIERRVEYQL